MFTSEFREYRTVLGPEDNLILLHICFTLFTRFLLHWIQIRFRPILHSVEDGVKICGCDCSSGTRVGL